MPEDPASRKELRAKRLAYVKEHLRCPHCEEPLQKWESHDTPYSNWGAEFLYVCVNPECPYFKESWERLAQKGSAGGAYCFVYDPSREWCGPMPARVPKTPRG